MDQEKTMFTCPFGTYAYRRIPFGLCNSPATFQRFILAIFNDMIEESVEVFMDYFSVFRRSFDNCLNNVDKMLQRCKDARLILNWEKCHFMLKEGIVLGHKIFSDLKHYFWEEPYLFKVCSDGPFLKSYKFKYVLVAVDYVSKWAKAQALPTNDARVVITFLKKLFNRFGMHKALISDRGAHFCSKIMEKTMKRYGVNHRFSTSYHPQTSGQVENTNIAIKRILEKTVKDNPAIWLRILDDALWAFALKNYNPDLIAAGEKRMFQLHKLDEFRHQAYENSCLYKARTKVWHDRKLKMRKEFKHGNKVLLFHAKYKFKRPKLISRWLGPYKDGKTFIVNDHRLKLYHEKENYNDLREAITPFFPKE
ncbi:reverse transcriptase domain-containing protein [Tanacetum coccineum]|uniref:Reverse transcriptase domain-containing protein n=1 Tax=Tanacetum coccineum TaxID=301880 RepID=A0ABQ4Y1R8_9ASTR